MIYLYFSNTIFDKNKYCYKSQKNNKEIEISVGL